MKIQGKYNSAEIFTENVDSDTLAQIYNLLNNPSIANSKIAIMPDVHMGKGAVVGFTMTFNNYIIPNIIGVDIGCGIEAYKIGKVEVDLDRFDMFVKENIPSGRSVHSNILNSSSPELDRLIEKVAAEDYQRIISSIGTLGGGNHFLELDKDNELNIWLVVHSGSRNFGLKVCYYHQNKAKAYIKNKFKGAGAYHGMEFMPFEEGGAEYLEDMQIAQKYAFQNRTAMCRTIIEDFFNKVLTDCDHISSIHNYFNFKDKIIRKGAIAAPKDAKVIIPLNMRDGSIVAIGKGNPNWNFSAPHGAGRLLSRSESKELITMEEFQESMKGIFSSSIHSATIDESPMVYKPSDEIMNLIRDTVDIDFIMKPVYNFKSVE
jgi:RNA-splicing ligase RtcB